MANMEKLHALQSKLKQKQSNKELFTDVVVVHVGIEPTAYYPKMKNADGSNVKDEDGNDKRSETQAGWMYSFVQFGTGKLVKIVTRERLNVDLLETYSVSGKGYDIKQARMLFIDEEAKIVKY